jgi:hypothetical protein
MDLEIYPDQMVHVTPVGENEDSPGIQARLLSLSGRQIVLSSSQLDVAEGALLKVSCPSCLLLTRVIAVHRHAETATLEIAHALRKQDLSVIREKWF